ncbi:hypothetical protein H0H81_006343 [Sphagnurus paluster]|uniref:Uncharacterized protein n=1 Tax=Sphagnurus paluster TaxID=117069 RepID=A0A9P7FL85_9AGAR|nr:hypothetical protein H0H81_006343 [Sphagnurus paluster]
MPSPRAGPAHRTTAATKSSTPTTAAAISTTARVYSPSTDQPVVAAPSRARPAAEALSIAAFAPAYRKPAAPGTATTTITVPLPAPRGTSIAKPTTPTPSIPTATAAVATIGPLTRVFLLRTPTQPPSPSTEHAPCKTAPTYTAMLTYPPTALEKPTTTTPTRSAASSITTYALCCPLPAEFEKPPLRSTLAHSTTTTLSALEHCRCKYRYPVAPGATMPATSSTTDAIRPASVIAPKPTDPATRSTNEPAGMKTTT